MEEENNKKITRSDRQLIIISVAAGIIVTYTILRRIVNEYIAGGIGILVSLTTIYYLGVLFWSPKSKKYNWITHLKNTLKFLLFALAVVAFLYLGDYIWTAITK